MEIAQDNHQELIGAMDSVFGEEVDYDLDVYEAHKDHFMCVMSPEHREVETLEEFIARGIAFRNKIVEYGRASVPAEETILVVTHSRMINVLLDTLTKDEASDKYTWGTHTEVGQVFKTQFWYGAEASSSNVKFLMKDLGKVVKNGARWILISVTS